MKQATVLFVLAAAVLWADASGGDDIFQAAKVGDLATLRAMLGQNPGLANALDRYALAPLHWAAMNGQQPAAEILLANGADINRRTRLNLTALEVARDHGHPAFAEWLKARGADTTPGKWPSIRGPYVGEVPPGSTPALFSPYIISSILWDHGAPAFSADGQEVYCSVVFDDDSGCILCMKMTKGEWSRLEVVPFSQRRFRDVSPVLSADGKTLYFTSCRPVPEHGKAGDYNMWVSERRGRGWSEPRLLAPEIVSGKDGRPVFAGADVLYFGSWRPGSVRGSNIYRSVRVKGKFAAAGPISGSPSGGRTAPGERR